MKKSKQVVFVVGFPGALACEVADALSSREDTEVKLLVSPDHRREARKYTARRKNEISIVEGSDQFIDFGLSGKEYLKLADEVTAVLQLSLPAPPGSMDARPPARVAAREIIEFGLAAEGLGHIVALSHLDIAGSADGVFAERDLELGQNFADQFQEDRFRAERIYRRFMHKLPITVARAGWIAGAGQGLCPLIHLLISTDETASLQTKDPLKRIFAIDIKTLADIIVELIFLPPNESGRTLHLAFTDLPILGELISMVKNQTQNLVPAGFEISAGARRILRRSDQELNWSAREFFKKQPAKVRISTFLTERFLEGQGLSIPRFSDGISKSLVTQATEEIVGFR